MLIKYKSLIEITNRYDWIAVNFTGRLECEHDFIEQLLFLIVRVRLVTCTVEEFGIPNPHEIIKYIRGPSSHNVLHPTQMRTDREYGWYLDKFKS
jgi:hypothetical protein